MPIVFSLPVTEPVGPLQRGKFNSFRESPLTTPVVHLSLVKAVDRLGQGNNIAVTDAADRRLDPGVCRAFCIPDRDILATTITMVDKSSMMGGLTFEDGLLQCIQEKAGARWTRSVRYVKWNNHPFC